MSFEHQLQINSILRILRASLDKLRISLILPKMFENPNSARQRLSGSKYVYCLDLIEKYIEEKNVNPSDISPHLSNSLIDIIDYFQQNFKVLDYFNDWLDDLRPFDKSLIDSFQLLLMVTEQRLKKSAITELSREKKIHEAHQENKKVKTKIKVFEGLLKSRDINLKWKQAAEAVLIQKHKEDLAEWRNENNIKVEREIAQSSHKLRQIHVSNVAKEKLLEAELQRIRIDYERVLQTNLNQQKSTTDEKNKLLLQLEAFIKKFDETINDKVSEKLHLQDEYENQKQLFGLFMIEYYRVEAEYERIVQLEEEEEERENEQKALLFLLNRSARIIQKCWRKFRRAQKRAAKRDKRRGKMRRNF